MRSPRLTASLLPLAAAALFACATAPFAAAAAPTADSILSGAEAQARQQHKNVLLTFGASWCSNCHLFDHMLNDPTVGPILSRAFVHVELITGEHADDPRHSNTPGGLAEEDKLGGKNAGWPYLAVLNPEGKLLVDSFRPANGKPHADNIGYPATPDEIAWFVHMLGVAAPNLSAADRTVVGNWLQQHRPV